MTRRPRRVAPGVYRRRRRGWRSSAASLTIALAATGAIVAAALYATRLILEHS